MNPYRTSAYVHVIQKQHGKKSVWCKLGFHCWVYTITESSIYPTGNEVIKTCLEDGCNVAKIKQVSK